MREDKKKTVLKLTNESRREQNDGAKFELKKQPISKQVWDSNSIYNLPASSLWLIQDISIKWEGSAYEISEDAQL